MINKKIRKNRILIVLMAFLILASTISIPKTVCAEQAVDYLEIRVGYYGVELDDYQLVKTYHWLDLEENFNGVYEQAYSFFRQSELVPWDYTVMLYAANGVKITDLLSDSKIYYGDIRNILFYVVDAQGIWTAFDRDDLFQDRYYFHDIPGHRQIEYETREEEVLIRIDKEPIYEERDIIEQRQKIDPVTGELMEDEEGNPIMEDVVVGTEQVKVGEKDVPVYETQTITDYTKPVGISFDDCWSDYEVVPPILAYENSSVSYNNEFEHAEPDYYSMQTGNRFRLFFGQLYPTESRTHDCAFFVSRLYITLNGSPNLGNMPEKIDGSLGSHEVTFNVNDIYNDDMRDALSQYMNLNSTNEEVLRIDNIEYTASADYSDVSLVRIHYTVLKEGEASISASIGGTELTDEKGQTLSQRTQIQPGQDPQPTKDPTKDPEPTKEPDDQESEDPKKPGSTDNKTDSGSDKATGSAQDPMIDKTAENIPDTAAEQTVQTAENITAEELNAKEAKTVAYSINGNIMDQLNKLDAVLPTDVKADRDIDQVNLVDDSEEDKAQERMLLIYTLLGILGVMILGAIFETVSYRIRKNKRIEE